MKRTPKTEPEDIEARRLRVLARTRELAAAEKPRHIRPQPSTLTVSVPAAAVVVVNPSDMGLAIADGGARGRGQRARVTGDIEHMQAYAHALNFALAQAWLIDALPRPCVARQAIKRALAHVLKALDTHNASA